MNSFGSTRIHPLDNLNFHLLKVGFFAFAFITTIGVVLSFFIRKKLGVVSKILLLAISLGMAAVADMYYLEPNWIQVHTVQIQDSRLAPVVQGLKIVHLTDLHTRPTLGYRERSLIDKVNALKPDLIFITGDFLRTVGELNATIALVRNLHASIGIYGVPGNSDYHRVNIDGFAAQLSAAGVDLLRNESRDIPLPGGRTLRLAGVDDPVTEKAALGKTLGQIPPNEPVLLLAHSPDIFSKAVLAGVNLTLVGHTHGGQVGIPFLVNSYSYANRYPVMQGIVQAGKSTMYINRGIGTTSYPIRFFCRPEIAVIDVTP